MLSLNPVPFWQHWTTRHRAPDPALGSHFAGHRHRNRDDFTDRCLARAFFRRLISRSLEQFAGAERRSPAWLPFVASRKRPPRHRSQHPDKHIGFHEKMLPKRCGGV